MRIVVSGSRQLNDTIWIERALCGYLGSGDLVVTGGCRGVDKIAHDWARRMFCKTEVVEADWDKHGKAAGPIRNAQMIEDADLLIAFWDGRSRGTRNAIDEARKRGIETHIHYPTPVRADQKEDQSDE